MSGPLTRALAARRDAGTSGYLGFLADQLDPPHLSGTARVAARKGLRDDVLATVLREQADQGEAIQDLRCLLGAVLAIAMAGQFALWIFLLWWIQR